MLDRELGTRVVESSKIVLVSKLIKMNLCKKGATLSIHSW